jgi:hypothetical protein
VQVVSVRQVLSCGSSVVPFGQDKGGTVALGETIVQFLLSLPAPVRALVRSVVAAFTCHDPPRPLERARPHVRLCVRIQHCTARDGPPAEPAACHALFFWERA